MKKVSERVRVKFREIATAACVLGLPTQQSFGVPIRSAFAARKLPALLNSSLIGRRVLSSARPVHPNSWRDSIMEWTTPQHEEIDLNCEVSSYANAEL